MLPRITILKLSTAIVQNLAGEDSESTYIWEGGVAVEVAVALGKLSKARISRRRVSTV